MLCTKLNTSLSKSILNASLLIAMFKPNKQTFLETNYKNEEN